MSRTISLESVRAVRSRVERSIPECRAALEASGGDVEAAIAALQTDSERKRDAVAAVFARAAELGVHAPALRAPPAAYEQGHEAVLADFGRAIDERSLPPLALRDPAGLEDLRADYQSSFGRPLPPALDAFLSSWNGIELDASTALWGVRHDRFVLHAHEAAPADAFPFGEALDIGYLFLRGEEVWFFDYGDAVPVFQLSPNFASFLRDLLNAQLDVLTIIERSRPDAR